MKRGNFPSMLLFYFYEKVRCKTFIQSFLLIIFSIVLFAPLKMQATHISGADLSYKWISGNTFELTLTLYRDCSGIAAPNSVLINYKSTSCGYNLNVTLNKIPGTGMEITRHCDSITTNCNGGTNPGIQKYEYTGSVTLPALCTDWVFGYNICCRNCAITTLSYTPNNCSGVPSTYVEATLDNLTYPNNTSPVFTNVPVSFFCIGQQFHYNHGVYDADGDSLVYSLINPRASAGIDVVFNTGYSATNPISSTPPMTLGANGDLTMRPTALEVGVMAILVKEYRNGFLIGTVVRDMEVWTYPCSNILPSASGINGTTNYNVIACPGQTLSFNINSADADVSQNVTMDWNYSIPGGVFNSTSGSRPVGTFTWTPTLANARPQPYTFTVSVKDDNCPFNGYQTYAYNITVKSFSSSTTSTNSACSTPGSGTATATASGDSPFQYLWSPGGATTSSINGLFAGDYIVTITDGNGCILKDTATVNQTSTLTATIISSSNPSCNGGNNGIISINAFAGIAPYNYTWSPSAGSGATATGLPAGTYSVVVNDGAGCVFNLNTTLTQPSAISASVTGSSLLCNGDLNGSASVSPTGGTAPFTYNWSNGATTSTVSALTAGSYSVTVTDANSCTASSSANITQPVALSGGILSSTNVTCNGGNNGSGQVTASGGTSPYRYSWFPSGDTLSSANGLTAGNYVVTITDAQNCSTTVPVNITEPLVLNSSITNFGNVLCSGDSSGYANVSESGGTSPYSYTWLPNGENTPLISGLDAGNYSVTVTDAHGCNSTASITLTQPSILSLSSLTINNVSCYAGSNGSAIASVSGGNGPYTYQWLPSGGNSSIANNLTQGNYSVTVTDANSCTTTQSFTIIEPPQISSTVSSTDATCFNGSDGSVTATASGGSGTLNYSWNPGNYSVATVTGLSGAIYYLKVTDSNGCIHSDSVLVDRPPGMTLTTSTTISTCKKSNGNASVIVSGGNPGYTYLWSPVNSNSDSLNNIPAGVYEVVVTDANGCTSNAFETVSNAGAADIILDAVTHVSCQGGNDGSISISLTGGQGPFSYDWTPSGGTSPTATGLSAGNYSIEVTGKHNCKSLLLIPILEPELIQSNISASPVSCFGANDGSVAVNITGGTGVFNYTWNNSIGNSPSGNGLPAGNYSVMVSDQNGCTTTMQIDVTEPLQINLTVNSTTVSCYGRNDGAAGITVNGGVPPYSYNWTSLTTNSSQITNLTAGNYSVTVTDSSGCISNTGIIVSQPADLTAQVLSVTGTCNFPNGSASVNMIGGTPPYTYLWSQTGETTQSVTGLPAGNYNMTATDFNGCQITEVVNIANSGMFTSDISSITNVRCNGGSDGSVIIIVSNGTTPYTFNWQPSGGIASVANNLSAGNYSVTITDGSDCTMNVPVVINEPPALSATITATDVKCSGDGNGAASAIVNGGTGSYTYKWLPGGFNSSVVGALSGGSYSFEVTDGNNCSTTELFVIKEPLPINLSTSSVKAGCNLSNGSASVSVTGGVPPYSYLWNPGASNGNTLTGISAGAYSITVTDSNNCNSLASASVSNTTGPGASLLSNQPVNCFGGNDGSAEVKINGGVSPYIINWHPFGGTSTIANILSAGSYSVTIRDSNNCITSIPLTISQPPQLHSFITPTAPLCYGGSNGSAIATISGGIPPYEFLWNNGDTTSNAKGLSKGTYSLQVTDAHGCPTSFAATINEPSEIQLTLESAPVFCYGRNDGFAAVIATGGTPGYSYLWSNGSIYSSGSNFLAGNYTVTVKDAHGCPMDTSLTVTEPSLVTFSTSSIDISCRNINDGQGTVTPTGGIPPYTYLWLPYGGNNSTATNLSYGLYDIVVKDYNGCYHKVNINIGWPAPISFSKSSVNVKCFGGNDGSASVSASGGTQPLTYFWTNGSTTNTATGLQAGSYTVIITDAHSCTVTSIVDISQPTPLDLTVQTTSPICIGQSSTISALSTGGTPPYTYTWWNGSHSPQQVISPSVSANYNVSVVDARGCLINNAVGTVNVNPRLLAMAIGPDTICEGDFATLMALCSGGDGGPYTYSWDIGATNDVITVAPLTTRTYSVIISDGCGSPPVSANVSVFVRASPDVNFIPNPAMGCQPLLVDFKDQSNMDGMEYYWNFGDGSSDTTKNPSHIFLNPGDYTVNHLVKSEHGCVGKTMVPAAVRVFPVPIAGFSNSPDNSSILDPIIAFFDESINAAKWEWDFGDNTGTFIDRNIEHTYNDTGTFIVKLITTSSNGCIDTAFGRIIIKEEFAVYIPNAFTPNNDGVNEYFNALGIGIKEFEMDIYNRWGLFIFHSSDLKKGWDGKVQGSDEFCPIDVYLYKINIIDLQNKIHNYVGRISLVR